MQYFVELYIQIVGRIPTLSLTQTKLSVVEMGMLRENEILIVKSRQRNRQLKCRSQRLIETYLHTALPICYMHLVDKFQILHPG